MAIRHKKLRLVSKRKDERGGSKKHSIGSKREHNACINEFSDSDMTEDELLHYYLSKDNIPIPDVVKDIIDNRALAYLRASGICLSQQ